LEDGELEVESSFSSVPLLSMVVHYFDTMSVALGPLENNPVLSIDSDAPKSSQVASQRLEVIVGRHLQHTQIACSIQPIELPSRDTLKLGWKYFNCRLCISSIKNIFSRVVTK
jgi:hypothetical protein